MLIREATESDAEDILEYCKVIGGESDNLTFGAEGLPITVDGEREFLKNFLNSDKKLFLIAVNDEEIVGIATFIEFEKKRLSHRAEISLSVKKSMWGKHIGTRLMEEIIKFAKNTVKTEIISLEVRSDNERAIALYKKFGFETIGVFPGFMKIDGKDITCNIMCLKL